MSRLVAATSQSRPINVDSPMPFGKHKGIPLDRVPRDYLGWALRNMDCCNPDHDRYWPEFVAALESIVGSQLTFKPSIPSLPALCALLAAKGAKLSARDGDLVVDGPSLSEEIQEALRVHKAPLLAIVALIERPVPGNGSAKLIWSADLRCRIKTWYGRMSRQFHPDAGGSTEGQAAVNQCYRNLMDVLEKWESEK